MIPENITLLLRGLEESVCLSKVFIELLGCMANSGTRVFASRRGSTCSLESKCA